METAVLLQAPGIQMEKTEARRLLAGASALPQGVPPEPGAHHLAELAETAQAEEAEVLAAAAEVSPETAEPTAAAEAEYPLILEKSAQQAGMEEPTAAEEAAVEITVQQPGIRREEPEEVLVETVEAVDTTHRAEKNTMVKMGPLENLLQTPCYTSLRPSLLM